ATGPTGVGGGNAWGLTGNTGTVASTNFVGTADAVDFVVRTNNFERMRVMTGAGASNINVVVGTTAPVSTADILTGFTTTGRGVAGYSSSAGGTAVFGVAQNNGFAAQFQNTFNTSTQPVVYIKNAAGSGSSPLLRIDPLATSSIGITILSTVTTNNNDGIEIQKYGATGRGIDLYMKNTVATTDVGISITHDGTGIGEAISLTNTASINNALALSHVGDAVVLNVQNSSATSTQPIGQFSQSSTDLSTLAAAVLGQSSSTRGGVFLASLSDNNTVGVYGEFNTTSSNDAIGVYGKSVPSAGFGYGVYGEGLNYGVFANGDLGASGAKTFAIDHPLDPSNKILRHFSIESPEVLNVYRGNVVLDASGEAVVQLPSYFHSVNREFSYVLTPIGAMANLYVKQEVDADGKFKVAGGNAGMKISWYVYAERNDPYMQQYPEKRQVEIPKRDYEVGKYIRPDLYGQPKEKGIFYRGEYKPIPLTKMPEPKPEKVTDPDKE
nr:hypothetical protein [Chitinophagales bacterium]